MWESNVEEEVGLVGVVVELLGVEGEEMEELFRGGRLRWRKYSFGRE